MKNEHFKNVYIGFLFQLDLFDDHNIVYKMS